MKGKGTGFLTNNNFVSGDWLGAGFGAGLTGDGSTKKLATGLIGTDINLLDCSLSAYITNSVGVIKEIFGCGGADPNRFQLWELTGTPNVYRFQCGLYANTVDSTAGDDGFALGSSRSATDRSCYKNGANQGTDTGDNSTATGSTNAIQIFASNGPATYAVTLTFAHIGTGLTDTDASNLSNRVNTLMTALGCNVY